MKDKTAFDQLRQQFRRLQGSVNYWNNAARAAQRGADKHTGQRKNHDLQRLAEFTNKALAANKQLDQIKTQLTELDPKGARARQLNALRSAIARANREIQHCEHLANLPGQNTPSKEHWQARLTRQQAKLQQLLDALAKHNAELNRLAQQQRGQAELIAATDRAYGYHPFDPAELQHSKPANAGSTDMAELDPPQIRQVIDGLCKAIATARQAGDLARAESLTDVLAHQLELLGLLDDLLSDDDPTH